MFSTYPTRVFCLLACLFCLPTLAFAQGAATCKVVDEDGAPVPFVTVYAPISKAGLITEDNGDFKLSDKFDATDTLRLSCLSYDDRFVAVTDLTRQTDCRVTLTSDAIDLQSVTVRDERLNYREETIGYKPRLAKAFYDFSEAGVENGIFLKPKTPVLVDHVSVQFGKVTLDSVFLELNFYEVDKQSNPTKHLQEKRVIHRLAGTDITNQVYEIDVTDQYIRSDKNMLVTLRTLSVSGRDDGKMWIAGKMKKGRGLMQNVDGQWKESFIHPLMEVDVRLVEEAR